LETEGLVQSVAHHGPIVARPDPSKAAEIYEIRALLEGEAARSCALKATDGDVTQLRQAIDRIEQAFAQASPRDVLRATTDFYELFFTCANKLVAWHVVQLLNGRINHLRAMTIATPGRDRAAISEMRRILNAIERKDGDAAYAASVDHVNSVAELAQRVLAQSAAADASPSREQAGV
jgi:DNA-binding GntR family transcriptional regulator